MKNIIKNFVNKMYKKCPTGIKIIAVLNFITGIPGAILGVILLFGGITFASRGDSFAEQLFGSATPGTLGSQIVSKTGQFYGSLGFVYILTGFLLLVISILLIILGIQLRKGKNWAKITQMILVILFVVLWLIRLFRGGFSNLFLLIISLIILFYLLFSKNVKNYFS